jgi:hypothetical protein
MNKTFLKLDKIIYTVLVITSGVITITASPVIKKTEIESSFSTPGDTSLTLTDAGDQLILSSKKSPEFFAFKNNKSKNSYEQASRLSYHWSNTYSTITSVQNKYYMLCAQNKIVYTAEDLGGTEKPFCDLKKIFGNTDDNTKGELCPDVLGYDGKNLYIVIMQGYSSRIVAVDPSTVSCKQVCYTKGIPAGLHYSNDTLWYIGNGRTGEVPPHIMGIPAQMSKTGKPQNLSVDVLVPFKGLSSGIVVKDGSVFCYNKTDSKIYKLKVK